MTKPALGPAAFAAFDCLARTNDQLYQQVQNTTRYYVRCLRSVQIGDCANCGRSERFVYDDLEAYTCCDDADCAAYCGELAATPEPSRG